MVNSVFESEEVLKIALVSDSIAPFHHGGKENRINEIISRVPSNCKVDLYTMDWKSVISRNLDLKNVSLIPICKYHHLYSGDRRSMKQAFYFALSTFKLIFKDFDIIEADQMPNLQLFPLKIVSILKRKKLVVTWHEYWGLETWSQYLGPILGRVAYYIELLSLKLPDSIVAASDFTYSRLKYVNPDDDRIIEISGAVDEGAINSSLKSKIIYDFIYVGRLIKHKNIDQAIKAFASMHIDRKDIRFAIIGSGPERENLENLSISLNIEDAIDFIDHVDKQEEMWGFIKSAKVFVSFSNREGFGLTVAEALFCGTPVITSDHSDNASKKLIIDGINGSIVKADSSIELEKAMRYWLSHSGEIKHDLQHLTWNKASKKYYLHLRSLTNG